MTVHTQSQLDALHACIAACEHCSSACLQEADVQMMARCIRLARDSWPAARNTRRSC